MHSISCLELVGQQCMSIHHLLSGQNLLPHRILLKEWYLIKKRIQYFRTVKLVRIFGRLKCPCLVHFQVTSPHSMLLVQVHNQVYMINCLLAIFFSVFVFVLFRCVVVVFLCFMFAALFFVIFLLSFSFCTILVIFPNHM